MWPTSVFASCLRRNFGLCRLVQRLRKSQSVIIAWSEFCFFFGFYCWKQLFRTLAWGSICSNPYWFELTGFRPESKRGTADNPNGPVKSRAFLHWAMVPDASPKILQDPPYYQEWDCKTIHFGDLTWLMRCGSPHQDLVRWLWYPFSDSGRGRAVFKKINTGMVRGATMRRP